MKTRAFRFLSPGFRNLRIMSISETLLTRKPHPPLPASPPRDLRETRGEKGRDKEEIWGLLGAIGPLNVRETLRA